MNDDDHLDDIKKDNTPHFESEIEAFIKKAESMRLHYMQKQRGRGFISMSVGLLCVMVGGGAFGWFFLMELNLVKALASIALAITVPLLLHFWAEAPRAAYKKAYKAKFMPQMAQLLGGLKFHPNRGVPSKMLKKTGLFQAFDRYEAEDCFMGRYKDAKILFSEAKLYVNTNKSPFFSGLMIYFETSEAFSKGHTIITADKDLAARNAKTRWHKLKKIPLSNESAQWNDFDVFSNREDDAKTLVNPGLLKELYEAAQIFDRAALSAVIFDRKRAFIAIPHDGDMFEASDIHAPVLTHMHAKRCKKEIEQILEIIDIFDLYRQQRT